jgi:hypothetical protein
MRTTAISPNSGVPAMTARTLGNTDAQWQTLCVLRAHYQRWRDWSSVREVQRLQFARWLCVTGRLRR